MHSIKVLTGGVAEIDRVDQVFSRSTFQFQKEVRLHNSLLESLAEFNYAVAQFELRTQEWLTHGTPETRHYLAELNGMDPGSASPVYMIEFMGFDLSTFFKTALVLARSSLDKLVPLYSYRFMDNAKTFSDKGSVLIRRISENRHLADQKGMIDLLTANKGQWIDELVDLRDEYIHYSELKEYRGFLLDGARVGQRRDFTLADFDTPSVELKGGRRGALVYLREVQDNLHEFIRAFLVHCDFSDARRPKRYLSCDDCGFAFAKKIKGQPPGVKVLTPISIQVEDASKDYGFVECPKCGGITETDLQMWRELGVFG